MLTPAEQIYADQILALQAENAALRHFLIKLMRTIKEVELVLQAALDMDSH
jgi:hypothetical protein